MAEERLIQCIYCMNHKLESDFRTREHVMPAAFGLFEPDNFILRETVCDVCNQLFGNTIELWLTRDTLEGRMRFDYGVRSPQQFKTMGSRSNIEMRAQEGVYEGAWVAVSVSPDIDKLIVKPIPQAGLRRQDGGMDWFKIDDLPVWEDSLRSSHDTQSQKSILVLGIHIDEALEKFKSKGWNFKPTSELEDDFERETMKCGAWGSIDINIQRALAKIAFNYLAHTQGHEYACQPEFDQIRGFIRYGHAMDNTFLYASSEAVLEDEVETNVRRVGHLLTLNRGATGDSCVSQVSLFNFFKYSICLSTVLPSAIQIKPSGRFFCIKSRKIFEMGNRPRKPESDFLVLLRRRRRPSPPN